MESLEQAKVNKLAVVPIKVPLANSETQQRVRGLTNLGNTCFFNSAMQCLGQTPFLSTIFKDEVVLPGGRYDVEGEEPKILAPVKIEYYSNVKEIITAFKVILEELQTSGGVYNPSQFFDKFTKLYPQFGGGDQHDSHELLRHLLDSVVIAEHSTYYRTLSQILFEGKKFKHLNKSEQQIMEWYANQAKERFLIERVFQGSLESTLRCEDCSKTSPNVEKFLDISLPVVTYNSKCDATNRFRRQKSNAEIVPALTKRQQKKEKKKLKREAKFNKAGPENQSIEKSCESSANSDSDSNDENSDSSDDTKNDDDAEDVTCKNFEVSLTISLKGGTMVYKKHSEKNNGGKPNNNLSTEANTSATSDQSSSSQAADESLQSYSSDPSITIGPPYIPQPDECSIQTCLNAFIATELLSGNNKVGCETCTKRINGDKGKTVHTNATKQFLISSLPAVLILHLKRFQVGPRHIFRKLSTDVKFPLILDMGPFCAASPQISKKYRTVNRNQKKILYSLYGVVEHSGGMHGGHYIAYVKVRPKITPEDSRWKFVSKLYNEQREKTANGRLNNGYDSDDSVTSLPDDSNVKPPPGKWYYASDSRVTEVSEEKVLNAQAYLLFYERIF